MTFDLIFTSQQFKPIAIWNYQKESKHIGNLLSKQATRSEQPAYFTRNSRNCYSNFSKEWLEDQIKNLEIRIITTFGLKIDFWQKQVGRHTLLRCREGFYKNLIILLILIKLIQIISDNRIIILWNTFITDWSFYSTTRDLGTTTTENW